MKNDPLTVITTRDVTHESLSLQTGENKHDILNPKRKGRSCAIDHEPNPKARQYFLQEMALWNFPTTGSDQEANFLSFTWEVNSDYEIPFRDESFSPCLWRGVRSFVCLWDIVYPWLQLGSVICSNVFWQFLFFFSDKDQKLKSHWISRLGYYQGGTEPESWKHTRGALLGHQSQPSQG